MFRVSAKPSRISSHSSTSAAHFQMFKFFSICTSRGRRAVPPAQPAMTLSLSFHQHPKKLLGDKSHPLGTAEPSICCSFPQPSSFRHETFFPAHAFLKDTVRFCINKEMRHDSSRLRRKYHNHPNNINSLEKTLGAVNTLL